MACALVVGMLGAWEGYLRSQGCRPGARSDANLWGFQRLRTQPDDIVLLGVSVSHSHWDGDTIEARTGRRPRRLEEGGTPVIDFLEDLAAQESYRGLVFVELNARFEFSRRPGDRILICERFLAARDKLETSPAARWEVPMQAALQERLAFLHPSVSLPRLWTFGLSMSAQRWRVDADRSARNVYRGHAQSGPPPALPPPCQAGDRDLLVSRFARAIRRLQARGARVVLWRLPSTGPLREAEARIYPRAEYWDRLVATCGVPAIHFEDLPSWGGVELPDGAHVDFRDAPALTSALLEGLEERYPGLLPRAEPR